MSGTRSWPPARSAPRYRSSPSRRPSQNRRRKPRSETRIDRVTRTHKLVNLIGVALPFLALITAIALLWNRAIGPLELGLLVGTYVVTCLGVTLGYHRM